MDRKSHPKHMATFIPAVPPVDTYLEGRWEGDSAYPKLNSGISKPIYDFNGNIHFSLPLEDWPPNNDYHREVYLMQRYGNLYNKMDPRFKRTRSLQSEQNLASPIYYY